MNRYLEQIQSWYGALDSRRQRMLWSAAAITLFGLAVFSYWNSRVPFSPLMTKRDYDDILEAASALESQGIPYRMLGVDGIEVPTNSLGKARAAVTAHNALPGLADVGELKLGLTPQAQQWAFLRAREGDVARMINGIEGISASQVNIVPREESLYFDEERPASASVFIKLKPGSTLGDQQVQAISNLVSSAVDGLTSDHVTVADDRGNLLAAGSSEPRSSAGNDPKSLLEYQSAMERRYERSVTQSLLPVLGYSDGFSVTAAVELDLTSRDTVTKQFETQKQAVVSEQIEESENQKKGKSAVPGTDANLPERTSAGAAADQASKQSASTTNYKYPTVDEVAHKPAGGVQRLSVAVQVDERRLKALAEAGEGKDIEVLKKEIDQAVKAAVGFDATRKDVVSVSFIPFAEPKWTEGTELPPASLAENAMPYGIAALGLVLVFLFVVRPLMKVIAPPPVAKTKTAVEPLPNVASAEENIAAMNAVAAADAQMDDEDRQGEPLAEKLRSLVDNYERVEASDLNRLIEREADFAVEVIRKWNARR